MMPTPGSAPLPAKTAAGRTAIRSGVVDDEKHQALIRLKQNSGSGERAAASFIGCMIPAKPLTRPGQARRRPLEARTAIPDIISSGICREAILVVLDDGGHRFERELAVGVLDYVCN